MAREGVEVKLDPRPDAHMHNKFAIIDDGVLINGSFNWTTQAVRENQENILLTDQVELVQRYLSEFDKLWSSFRVYQP